MIYVRLSLIALTVALGAIGAPAASAAGQDVVTQHNDNQRTGANDGETQLTPANVSQSFGLLYKLDASIGGQTDSTIGAQPLYVSSVAIDGATYEVLYVTTRRNLVFAFDVGNPSLAPEQRLLWKTELRDSRGFGAEELPGMDARFAGDSRPLCFQTHGPVGIASTPVIDPATNTMWVVYRTSSPLHRDPNNAKLLTGSPIYDARFYLRKIDIRTGANLGEQQIRVPTGPNEPAFDPNKVLTRTGLLLLNGVVYLGFAGAVCDTGGGDPQKPPPHGWILALDAGDLRVVGYLNTTPHSSMGGIWQSGSGLAADRNGFVYALTGNHEGGGAPELADSMLKVQRSAGDVHLKESHFTAPDWQRLDAGDTDPASGGAVALPNGLVLGGGKEGHFYLVDPANMSAPRQSFQAFYHSWHDGISPCDYDLDQTYGPNIHGTPVVWHPNGVPYALVYEMPEKDYLKVFRVFDDGRMEERPFVTTQDSGIRSPRGMPGGALSLSADGGKSGVLWVSVLKQDSVDALNTSGQFLGRLIAFDALSLNRVWEAREQLPFAKYIPPTIGGGKVFRSTYSNEIYVYGLSANHHTFTSPSFVATRSITAIWRDGNHLDLFATTRQQTDGNVVSTNWEAVCVPPASPVTRGWRGWFPINSDMDLVSDGEQLPAGSQLVASGAAPVAAVLAPNRPGVPTPHVDLFVAAYDGQVMSTVWEPPNEPTIKNQYGQQVSQKTKFPPTGWQKWFPVAPGSVSVAPRQPTTALWRPGPAHLDLFTVGKDGRVMSTFFENDKWQPAWSPIDPSSGGMTTPGQTVTALWRNANHLDLFMTDKGGRVMSTFFENDKWQPTWFAIGPASGMAMPGQTITALWSNPNHLDLFMTGKDGRVMSTFFDNNQWVPGGWFAI
ncbi:MAG TPA: hypothetical protein VH855_19105 [Acetobacteraceae bacterium]